MKKFPKELKFFFTVFFVWTLFFSVSSPVLALENSFDYVHGINYEPIAKLVNFLNDKKSELEKLGDSFGKINTVKRQILNTAKQNTAKKPFLLSAVLNPVKDAVVGKPKQYFGKVFCIAKDFVFPGSCDDNTNQDYTSITASKKNNEEEIDALKNQYDDAIISANELNQKFNLLQQELGKVKAGGVIIKEPIIEQKTVERTIEKIVSGLSQDDLSASIASIKTELNNLNTNLTNQINNLSFNTSRQSTAAFQAISLTNKIDSLSGTRLSGIIVNGVSGLTNADIPDDITASNYLPLTGGTISGDLTINGNATLGVITLQNATAGYFTATSTAQASTFPYASTTALTVSGGSWFGGLSTMANLLLAGSTTLQNFTANNSTTTNATTTNLVISGSAYIGSLNGPLQANNGLISATTSVGYQYGGTGLTATPSFGQILRGTGTGYSLVATSTLGINTNDITEGSNLFWTNDRFDNRLSATTTLPNLTTLANLSITGSQVSNLNTLWDNRMSATTSLQNITTLANLATVGTIASGIWNGSSIGNAYVDDDITLTNLTQITNRAISDTTGTLAVARGGTGQTAFSQGWLHSDGTTLSASTSPTVNYITATSTTATSTFAGGLFVAGHCVTGDTRLRRRRKKKNGEGYDYDEVEIKDIQVGDEIASLDEETGKIVWSKVNALMDMGVKKIYKLTTVSGKTIRTTAEHPYFIKNNKISSKKAIAFIDYANIKAWARNKKLAIDMKALKEILSAVGVNDVMFYYGVDIKNEKMAGFIDVLKKIGYQTITKPLQYFRVALIDILNQSANINWMETLEKSLKENLIKEAKTLDSKNHKLLVPKANFDVEITIDALKNISKFDTFLFFSGDGDFTPLIQKVNELGKNTAVIAGREFMSATLREMAKIHVKLEDVVKIVPQIVYSLSENGSYKKPTPAQEERVWENCASNIADLLGLSNCSVDNLATNKSGLWKKVVYLKEGMEIAINDAGNDKAVFDKITKIEILPEEQVYDIEIEGTHNFIGNDIVAHNTYIGGTASSTNLIVSNNSALGTVSSGIWNGSSIGDAYLTKSGDWTGTLDGQEGSYYSNASNLSNFGSPFYAFFSATNTDALTQGSTNKYWSNTLFDNRLSATTTLPNLTTLLGLTNASTTGLTVTGQTTLATALTGLLKGASGVVSAITTSLGLAGEISDETGSGALVFGTSPTFTTQITTPSIVSAGALGITPASGSNLNVNLAGAGDFAVNTNQLYVDTSTGNVGIGTTAPGAKLAIDNTTINAPAIIVNRTGNTGIAYTTIRMDTSGVAKWYMGMDSAYFGGTDTFSINNGNPTYGINISQSTGNVGIGTTSPSSLLSLKGSSGAQMTLAQADTNYTKLTVDASGNFTLTPSGSTITIPDDNLKVCAGDACQTTALNSGNGNLTVENNIEIGGNYNRTCATGYVWVPGSSKFGTLPGFCTMKYEAKNDGSNNAVSTATGGPYVSIDQPTSRTKCEAVGLGYHLINEMEWMTIAENIAQTPINDMDDDAGLQLATGHSDNAPASALAATSASDPVVSGCNLSATMENAANAYSASSCEIRGDGSYGGDDTDKGFYGTGEAWATTGYSAGAANKAQLRTHILSNGNVVWDIAGNVWEWTDAYVNGTVEKPAPTADAWAEFTAITDYTALNYLRPQNPAWTSANGIGKYYAGASAGQRGFIRGGGWNDGAGDGVFTLDLSYAPSGTATSVGFRCSR